MYLVKLLENEISSRKHRDQESNAQEVSIGRRCEAGPDSGAAEHHADWRLHQSDGAAEKRDRLSEDKV